MFDRPRLSICVPSRNRQVYFQQTIRDLIRDPDPDIEFVFADNSDDPRIMDEFIAGIDDPRVQYLRSEDRCLAMEDNWERTAAAARGEWISIIGDDDFIDTSLCGILAEIQRQAPETECVGWSRLVYRWPNYRPTPGNIAVQTGNKAFRFPREQLIGGMFRWENAGRVPSDPFTIYHGAVRRGMLDKIHATFGRRHFEHPVVDYEYACKIIHSARHLVYLQRPISVLGACQESNSAAVNNFEKSIENYETLLQETGGGAEASEWMRGFPFKAHLGLAGCVMGTQHWFKSKYSFPVEGWEKNFVVALAKDCSFSETRRAFDLQVELCRRTLADWRGGAYLKFFEPCYVEKADLPAYTGLSGDALYLDDRIGDACTPAEVFAIVRAIIDRPEDISYELKSGLKKGSGLNPAAGAHAQSL